MGKQDNKTQLADTPRALAPLPPGVPISMRGEAGPIEDVDPEVKPSSEPKARIMVVLPPEMKERLDKASDAHNATPSVVIYMALVHYFETSQYMDLLRRSEKKDAG